MEPYEALYRRKCRTPEYWDQEVERRLFGLKLIQLTTSQIRIIRIKLKTIQDRQKSYADKKNREIKFEIGDKVFLKVLPQKGIMRFGWKGKLSP